MQKEQMYLRSEEEVRLLQCKKKRRLRMTEVWRMSEIY